MASSRFASGFAGFLIGVVTGLAVAAGAAYFLALGPSPFMEKVGTVTTDVDPAQKLNGDVNPNDLLNKNQNTASGADDDPIKTVIAKAGPDAQQAAAQDRRVYWLQVGAFKDEQHAADNCGMLSFDHGLFCQSVKSNGLWRNFVGPYSDRVEALNVQSRLKDSDVDSTILFKEKP